MAAPATEVALAWTRLDLPQVGETTQIGAVLADGDGYVVAGGINMVPAIWSSPNGLDWTVDRLPGPAGLTPSSGSATDAGMVLLGGGGTEKCAHPATAMTWARPAGGQWSVAPFDKILCANPYVAQLTSNGRELLLAGTGFGEVALVWTSTDGLAWVDATPPEMRETFPRAGAWTGTQYVVLAVAEPGTDEWTSPDGRTWKRTRQAIPLAMGSASLVRTGDTLVALLQGNDDRTTTWRRTADGTWEPLAIPGLDPSIELRAMLAGADRLVFLAAQAGRQVIVTWGAGDPTVSAVAGPGDAIDLIGLAVTESTVVVVGGVGNLDERHPAAWFAPRSLLP